MIHYFVVGGIFQDKDGNEKFALLRPEPGEPPIIMEDSVIRYFTLIWHQAHLYRVEEDYTLALVTASHQAMQEGITAPERITLNTDLLEELQAVIEPSVE